MTSQLGQQTIALHILPNFSPTKGNQALILLGFEDNKTNIFV